MKKFLSTFLGAVLLSSLFVSPVLAGGKSKAAPAKGADAAQVENKAADAKDDSAKEVKPAEVK